MTNPTISVIMPARNCEVYVAEAVQSILDQTFGDFELLVTDDASTDRTYDVLRGFSDARILLSRHEAPAGSAQTRIELFARARGNYIALMDADDISLPERLEKQLNYLRSTGYDGVGCEMSLLCPDGTLRPGPHSPYPYEPAKVKQALLRTFPMLHPSLVFHTSLARDLGGYRARVGLGYDLDFLLRMSEQAVISNMPDCLYIYREQPGSLSVTRQRDQQNSTVLARLLAVERRLHGSDSLHLYSDADLDAFMHGAIIPPPGHSPEEQRRILVLFVKEVLRRQHGAGARASEAVRTLRWLYGTDLELVLLAASLRFSACYTGRARKRLRGLANRARGWLGGALGTAKTRTREPSND